MCLGEDKKAKYRIAAHFELGGGQVGPTGTVETGSPRRTPSGERPMQHVRRRFSGCLRLGRLFNEGPRGKVAVGSMMDHFLWLTPHRV